MSREIKFRAWDKEANNWLEGVTYTLHTSGRLLTTPPHIELMQYTGVKDENDKEIYEGDIVQLPGTRRWGIVKWNTSKPEYYVYGKDGGLIDYALHGDWKIIGNIYEDPELADRR